MGTPAEKAYAEFEEQVKRTVYLDNLSSQVTVPVLRTALGQFGNVVNASFIPNFVDSKDAPKCALVEMENPKQAKSIVREMTTYPFMMSGLPRPVRALAAQAEMFVDRPVRPGRKIQCRWVEPSDPDFAVAKRIKQLTRRHTAEIAFLIKHQQEEEENLAKQHGESLKANYKKYELIEGLSSEGIMSRLGRRYGLKLADD